MDNLSEIKIIFLLLILDIIALLGIILVSSVVNEIKINKIDSMNISAYVQNLEDNDLHSKMSISDSSEFNLFNNDIDSRLLQDYNYSYENVINSNEIIEDYNNLSANISYAYSDSLAMIPSNAENRKINTDTNVGFNDSKVSATTTKVSIKVKNYTSTSALNGVASDDGLSFTIEFPTIRKASGYEAIGWAVDKEADASIIIGADEQSVILPISYASKTFYACYAKTKEFTFHYFDNINGVRLSEIKCAYQYMSSYNLTSRVSVPLKLPTINCEGCTFLGWATQTDSFIIVTEDLDFSTSQLDYYAVYNKDINIDYNLNGGVGNIDSQSISYKINASADSFNDCYILNNSITITDIIPTKQGCEFLGWSISNTSEIPQYYGGIKYEFNDSITLYAVYESMLSQGFVSIDNITKVFGDSQFALHTITNHGGQIRYTLISGDCVELNGDIVTILGAGVCQLQVICEATKDYSEAVANFSIEILKQEGTIVFTNKADILTYDTQFEFVVQSNSDAQIHWVSEGNIELDNNIGHCVNIRALSGVGTASIQVYTLENENYTSASATINIQLNRAVGYLQYDSYIKTYGDDNFILEPINSHGGEIVYEILFGGDKISLDNNTIAILGAGLVKIKATCLENDNYSTAVAEINITINKKTTELNYIDYVKSLNYNEDYIFTAYALNEGESEIIWSYVGNLELTQLTNDSAVVKAVSGSGSGSVIISVAESDNYLANSTTIEIMLGKAQGFVTASDINKDIDEQIFEITTISKHGGQLSYELVSGNSIGLDNNMATINSIGQSTVKIICSETNNYALASTTINVNIVQNTLSIYAMSNSSNNFDNYDSTIGGQVSVNDNNFSSSIIDIAQNDSGDNVISIKCAEGYSFSGLYADENFTNLVVGTENFEYDTNTNVYSYTIDNFDNLSTLYSKFDLNYIEISCEKLSTTNAMIIVSCSEINYYQGYVVTRNDTVYFCGLLSGYKYSVVVITDALVYINDSNKNATNVDYTYEGAKSLKITIS